MKRRNCILILIFLLLIVNLSWAKMTIGVVELEQQNDIGLENAGKIIAEIIVADLVTINKYDVLERVLLAKVVQEQTLGLTGIINSDTAPKIGELYGVQGIVTGSFMKVGKNISISARLINTETGKIISASKVKFEGLELLEPQLKILTNELSGITREKLKLQEDMRKRKQIRAGCGIGLGYATDDTDFKTSILSIPLNILFYSRWIDIDIVGLPIGYIGGFNSTVTFNASRYWGVFVGYESIHCVGDDAKDEARNSNGTWEGGSFDMVTFGATIRPSYKMKIYLGVGWHVNSKLKFSDFSGIGEISSDDVAVDSGVSFSNTMMMIDYVINDSWGVKGYFFLGSAEELYEGEGSYQRNIYYGLGPITGMIVNYSFSFSK